MKESDSLTYSTSGALAFNLSTGKNLVHAGFTYLAGGSWVTTVKGLTCPRPGPIQNLQAHQTQAISRGQLWKCFFRPI